MTKRTRNRTLPSGPLALEVLEEFREAQHTYEIALKASQKCEEERDLMIKKAYEHGWPYSVISAVSPRHLHENRLVKIMRRLNNETHGAQ